MKHHNKILLTCGLGDFIAIECYLSLKERLAVKTVYWATRARSSIQPLIPYVFPNAVEHVIVRDTWVDTATKGYSVASAAELPELTDKDVKDLSVVLVAEEVKAGKRKYHGSTLAKHQLADISSLNLPAEYFVVHPYSQNARTAVRDLTKAEWQATNDALSALSIPLVVVNKGDEILRGPPSIIDLSNKLSVLEALEVTKLATGFIGAASAFSVMAAKTIPVGNLIVKGSKDLKDYFADFYYAPATGGDHVATGLMQKLRQLKARAAKQVTINTVQGIGDIFWVYQKLAPHFKTINLNILCTEFSNVQERARDFCKMLPKIGEVAFARVSHGAYNGVVGRHYSIDEVLSSYEEYFESGRNKYVGDELGALGVGIDHPVITYAVNKPLEEGVTLGDIDPAYRYEEFVDLGLPAVVAQEDYLCVFVAGAKSDQSWGVPQWLTLIKGLLSKLNLRRVSLIGAEWDKQVQAELGSYLMHEYDVTNYVDQLSLAESIDVIRRSSFFVGYQSGLNIIAENYDAAQLMLYFDRLEPMHYTWCKPDAKGSRFFAAGFKNTPAEGLELIPAIT